MATTARTIRERVRTLLSAPPFEFTEAVSPFDLIHQPTGELDQVFRVEHETDLVEAYLGGGEERTDRIIVFLARKQVPTPQECYDALVDDADAIRLALIDDGPLGTGDYSIPNAGHGISLTHETGAEFSVVRLSIPVNYEVAA